MDLVIFYSPEKACITYYINNDSAGYKIEYPFSHVKSITLDPGDMSNEQGNGQKPGGLIIELNRPPMFFMDSSGSGGFYQCGDFTEEQQASQIMTHHLGGHPKVLSGQLTKLAALESFQNRHAQYDQPPAISASAPVSPLPLRPASQPSAAPHPQVGMFPESQYGMSLQPTARGHKRQRSRSVPIAVDFSLLHPMQSFHLPQQQAAPPNLQPPNLYAPIPQHHTNLGNMGSNLRIDTTTGYGLDFRQYPMSAATTTSPSDYASPFFTTGSTQDGMTAVDYNSPYSLPFLSPMIDPSSGMIAPSVSPLSMNHGDPIIANQSPPLSMHNITRSASADIFHMSTHDGSALTEDGISLSDLYSKQSLMPMHSPGMETHVEDMDMHQMVSFASLDADNVPMTP
ncbi:MAG: hypothetical protein M1829_005633 [Trizodia sp. TS-e1964]|nr:MAG: hypothetical protein M1829_005633 [Trizodia sp. TS-e1964]